MMQEKTIQFRPAQKEDAALMLTWRNDEKTRRSSFESDKILPEDHIKWLGNVLQDPQRLLLLAYHEEQAVGVLRFDQDKENCIVSIYLNPLLHGQGYGTAILSAGTEFARKTFPQIKQLTAKVLIDNLSSKKAFLKAGFKEKYLIMEYEL